MTAEGEAGDGNSGSVPPKALLLLPPLVLCAGIEGQPNGISGLKIKTNALLEKESQQQHNKT